MGERSPVRALVPLVAAAVTSLALAAYGCSSTETPPAAAAADTGVAAEASLTNACTNDKDKVSVFRSYCAPDPFEKDAAAAAIEYKSFAQVSSDCARFCVLDPVQRDNPACVTTCLKTATKGAISDTCLSCRVKMVECGRTYCLAECAPGPLDPKCLQCMCGDNYPKAFNCYVPYNACSGLNLPYCGQLEAGAFDGFPAPNDAGACD